MMKSVKVMKVLFRTFIRETFRSLRDYSKEVRKERSIKGVGGVTAAVTGNIFRRFDGVVNRIGMVGALEGIERNVSGAREEIMRATREGSRLNRPLLKFYLNGVLTAAALVEAMLSLSEEDGFIPHEVNAPSTLEEYRRGKVVKGYGRKGEGKETGVGSEAVAATEMTEAEREMRDRSTYDVRSHVGNVETLTDEEFIKVIMEYGGPGKLPQA